MTDQDAYRHHSRRAQEILEYVDTGAYGIPQAAVSVAGAQVHALLALAAAQDRVMPADRPTDDGNGLEVGFIVVDNEIVKPTQAAYAHKVTMTDDRGRKWRVAAGPDALHWEAVQV